MINLKSLKLYRKKIVLASILVALLMAIIIFLNLIFYRNDLLIMRVSPATNSINKALAVEKTGGSIELKSEDINGLIEFYMKNKKTFGGLSVSGIYSELSGSKINLYIPVKYSSFNLFLTCRGTIRFESNNIVFTPDYFALGKLSLPKDFVLKKLSSYIKDLNISKEKIVINKSILPFTISSLTLNNSSINVYIEKVAQAPVETEDTSSSQKTKTQQEITHDLLVRAQNQLNSVRASAASSGEKTIISRMQSIVSQMISNSSYQYQGEASSVKSDYGKLSVDEKDDLQAAILDNMDIDTLKKLKSTFGL